MRCNGTRNADNKWYARLLEIVRFILMKRKPPFYEFATLALTLHNCGHILAVP